LKTVIPVREKRDWALFAIIFFAALIRIIFLSLKPPHFDEGIAGWWVDQLIGEGLYPYDPTNYHGPVPYYLIFFFKFLMGRNIWALRAPSVLMGIGCVYILTLFKDIFGKQIAYMAAAFLAFSPGMIFYCRYTPHEVGLLFFSLLAVLGYSRFVECRDRKSLWQMAMGIAGMASTKETFSIHIICFCLALISLKIYEYLWNIKSTAPNIEKKYTSLNVKHAIFGGLLFIATFYSGFFLSWKGIIDFFRSFEAWFQTGTKGGGHDKPFWYWATLFKHYELAALAGFFCSFKILLPFLNRSNRAAHWLKLFAIYGLGTTLAYSIIPYKTPWCIIEFLWPYYFLVAAVISDMARYGKNSRVLAYVCLSVLLGVSCAQAIQLNFFKFTDDTEPYVYVQTYTPFMDIDAKVQQLVRENPENYHMIVKVFLVDTWPIPWMWGELTHAGYFGAQVIPDVDASVILADLSKRDYIEQRLTKNYYYIVFQLRAAQPESIGYFEEEKFKKLFPAGAPLWKPKVQKVKP
jgi:uncharacterized protein (TIGR03663 family)